MNREQILAEVAKRLEVELSTLTDETKFKEDLQADSLDLVEMIVDIEDDFGIHIEDEEAVNIKTIGDLVKIAENK